MVQKKAKVAIIGTRGYPSYYGGFETAVRKLAPYLVDAGWDVTVYGRHGATKPEDPDRDPRVQTFTTRGLETKSLSTLTYGLTAALHAVRERPDVALVMNVANGFWLPLFKLRGIKTVVNVDGIEWERAKWGKLAKLVFKLGARWTAKFGDYLVADSIEIQRRWKADFHRESSFIPYGGDETLDLPLPDGLRHRGYILVVARFVPENTMEEFFGALDLLKGRHPVVIVGSTGYGGDLDERAEHLSKIYATTTWLGHISNDRLLHSLWQHAGAYFHGHSVGGTNPALVQAMACGAPVVARDTTYNREVLQDTAQFVAPSAEEIAKSLSATMQRSLEGKFDPSQIKRRSRVHYSWEGVCEGYDSLLKQSLQTSRLTSVER